MINIKDGLYGCLYQHKFLTKQTWDRIEGFKNPSMEVEELLKLIKCDNDVQIFSKGLTENGQDRVTSLLHSLMTQHDGDGETDVSQKESCSNPEIAARPQMVQKQFSDKNKRPTPDEPERPRRKNVVRIIVRTSKIIPDADFVTMIQIWDSILSSCNDVCEEKLNLKEIPNEVPVIANTAHHEQQGQTTASGENKQKQFTVDYQTCFCNLLLNAVRTNVHPTMLTFYILLSDLEILEMLNEMHSDGTLQSFFNNKLIVENAMDVCELEQISLKVELSEIDYLTCWRHHAEPTLPKAGGRNNDQPVVPAASGILNMSSTRSEDKATVTVKLQITGESSEKTKEGMYKEICAIFRQALDINNDDITSQFINALTSHDRHIIHIDKGSILLRIGVPSTDSLEELKQMIDNDHLQSLAASEFLGTKHKAVSVDFALSITTVNYLQCWKALFIKKCIEDAAAFSRRGDTVRLIRRQISRSHVIKFKSLVELTITVIQLKMQHGVPFNGTTARGEVTCKQINKNEPSYAFLPLKIFPPQPVSCPDYVMIDVNGTHSGSTTYPPNAGQAK